MSQHRVIPNLAFVAEPRMVTKTLIHTKVCSFEKLSLQGTSRCYWEQSNPCSTMTVAVLVVRALRARTL